MSQSTTAVAVQGIGFGPLAVATQGLRGDAQKPRAISVQGVGFGPLSMATQGFRGVRGSTTRPRPEIILPRHGGSSGRDRSAELALRRAHRQALIRQQNDLILAIAVAVAGSGALD